MALNDAVPSSATDVFKRNAEDADRLINSDGAVTTRTGKVLPSWKQIVESRAYWSNRGAWTTATAYAVNDIWSDSGTWYLVLTAYTSGATVDLDIAGPNVMPTQSKAENKFEGVSDAVAAITLNPELFPDNSAVSTSSYRTPAECIALSIPYPDGGAAKYTIEDTDGSGVVDGIWQAGTKQLRLNDDPNGTNLEVFGGVCDGEFNDSVAMQNVNDFLINKYIRGSIIAPAKLIALANVNISQNIVVKGQGRNSTIFVPHASAVGGYVLRLLDNHSGVVDCGFRHDRSFKCDAINMFAPATINRWNILENLFMDQFDGSAIYCNNTIWEQTPYNVQARACGDNAGLRATFHIESSPTGDAANNVTFDRCFAIFPHYVGFLVNAPSSNPARKIKLINSMCHGGTSEGDLTTFPYSQVKMTNVDNVEIIDNNLTHAHITEPVIDISGESGFLSATPTIIDNTIETLGNSGNPIKLRYTKDGRIDTNKMGAVLTGNHLNTDSTNVRLFMGKQVIDGGNPLRVLGTPTYEPYEGLRYLDPIITGVPSIRGTLNWAGEESVTSNTSVDIVLPIEEPNALYRPFFSCNFASGGLHFTNKTSTGFTVNWPNSSSGVIEWWIAR